MRRWLRVISWVTASLYVVVGVLELILADDSLLHRVVFACVLTLFAALVLAGVMLLDVQPWLGVGLASVGALAGAVSLFWTVAAPLLAIAIVVLSILVARRGPDPAQPGLA